MGTGASRMTTDVDQATSDRVISQALGVALMTSRLLRAWHAGELDAETSMQVLWESFGCIVGERQGCRYRSLLPGNNKNTSSEGNQINRDGSVAWVGPIETASLSQAGDDPRKLVFRNLEKVYAVGPAARHPRHCRGGP